MNDLVKKLKVRKINKKFPARGSSFMKNDCAIEFDTMDFPEEFTEYEAFIDWGMKFYCDDRNLKFIIENIARQLNKDIYGELQDLLFELERNIYKNNRRDSEKLVREILNKIS